MRKTGDQRRADLIEAVSHSLSEVGERFRFEIVEPGVRKDEDWWYVPVIALTSDGRELPREFTNNLYSNVEEQFAREQHINVLFIPALPEPATS